jgi:Golgi phosphoprotein 3 (GPP34)
MLLAEELLLLLLDDEKGSVRGGFADDAGLTGALLLDLVEAGRVVEREGALVPSGAGPSSPQVLADAYAEIERSDRPRDANHWLNRLPKALKPLRGRVAQDLVARGVLGEERHKALGPFSSTRYPELDPGPEHELRARLRAVLVDGAEPDAHTALLLGLLAPLDLVGRLVEREHRKAAKARAQEVADRGAVGSAVADARRAAQAAVIASITAATVASTTATAGGG